MRQLRRTRKEKNHTSMVCNIVTGRSPNYYKLEKMKESVQDMIIQHEQGLDSYV